MAVDVDTTVVTSMNAADSIPVNLMLNSIHSWLLSFKNYVACPCENA